MTVHAIKRLAAAAAAYMLSACLHAQGVISGCVRDSRGEAVAAASVLLYADSLLTPPMKGYAVTGKDGRFSISASLKGGWLQAKCLGYADRVVHADGGEVMITLTPDDKTLGEVIVKGTYTGIKVSGDTVKFDTGHFSNGFESSVADILGKLPGVSVSEGGSVSYGGKAVGTLLVDGKDVFTGSSDGLVVKNMPADAVTGAEIISNYKGSDLSEGFSPSGRTALNIKTKGLGKASGYAGADGGHESKYNIKSFTLAMNDRLSLTAILSGNNTGTPVFSISDYLGRVTPGVTPGQEGQSLRLTGMEAAMLYRPDNLCKDMGNVAAFDMRYKASEKLGISGNVTMSHSDMYGRVTREETYLAEGTEASTTSDNRRRGHFVMAGMEADWKPGASVQLLTGIKVKTAGMNDGSLARTLGTRTTGHGQKDKYGNAEADGSLALNVKAGNEGKSDNIYAIANVEKRLAGVPLGMKASVSFNGMRASSTMNGIANITKLKSLKSTLSMSSNFRSALNGELSASYSHDRNEIEGADVSSCTDGINVYGKIMLRAGTWKFNAGCEYRKTISGTDKREIIDAGFMAECKIKAITLRLSAKNILNMKSTEWLGTTVTPYYSAVERYSRMPGHIMLGIQWDY